MRVLSGEDLRHHTRGTGILFLAALLLVSCTSSGGGKKKKHPNDAPVASAEADIVSLVGRTVTISGSGSDENDDKLTYSWTQVSGPDIDLGDADSESITFTVTQAGTYEFQLVANDGKDDSDPATQSVYVHDIDGGGDSILGIGFTVALKPGGTLWAWGDNSVGQLGDGTFDSHSSPARVCDSGETNCEAHPFKNVVAISAGRAHVVALKSDGTVWTWGDNSEGQLGIGSLADSSTPVQVCAVGESVGCETFLENVVAVRAGYLFSTALLEDGTLVSWGRNSDGELGTGDQTQRQIPDRVCAVGASWPCTEDNGNLLSGVIAFASGGGGHTIAILSNRSLAAWGFTKNGQVGTGHSADGGNDRVLIPEIVCGVGEMSSCTGKLSNIVAVDAWSALSVALDENGNLYAWGHNNYGQLGWNVADTEDLSGPDCQDTYCRNVPIQVCATGDAPCGEHFTGVESMAAGRRFSLALKTDHSVWAWGTNAEHELGAEMSSFCNVDYDAETPCTPIPVEVCTTGDDPCTKPLTGIAAIAAGTFNGYALSEDGTLWTWGDNTYGQLGIGSTATKTKPVKVSDY